VAKTKRKLARDALAYMDPRWTSFQPVDLLKAFLGDHDTASPVRLAAQATSDLSQLASLEQRLIAAGFEAEVAGPALLELLLRPTVALARSTADGDDLLQAVVVSRDPQRSKTYIEDSDLRLWIRVSATGNRPPRIEVNGFGCDLFDTQETSDVGNLFAELTEWLSQFPLPLPAGKAPGGELVLLGNPANANLSEVPPDWSAQLIRVAAALGMSFRGVISHSEAVSFSDCAVIVSVDSDVARAAIRNGTPEGFITKLTSMRKSFGDLLLEITNLLLARKSEADEAAPQTSRSLSEGERVFHRKIGNSRKFDRFDAGSPAPCKHGQGGFVRFHGPKSTKGMERRYTNFTPDMLFHCGKYPNCGVYAAFHNA
jgi:hypothetical protein